MTTTSKFEIETGTVTPMGMLDNLDIDTSHNDGYSQKPSLINVGHGKVALPSLDN